MAMSHLEFIARYIAARRRGRPGVNLCMGEPDECWQSSRDLAAHLLKVCGFGGVLDAIDLLARTGALELMCVAAGDGRLA